MPKRTAASSRVTRFQAAATRERLSARDGRGPGRSSRWRGGGRTRQRRRSAVALHRFGTRPHLLTQAAMIRSRGLYLCASREPFASGRARGKSIHPLVGKIRLGPKLQRTGALDDAGAFDGRPVGRATLRLSRGVRDGYLDFKVAPWPGIRPPPPDDCIFLNFLHYAGEWRLKEFTSWCWAPALAD
jgi:hypothetical protein